jgi:hypothetical protein
VNLLDADANQERLFNPVVGRFFLVQAKHLSDTTPNLSQHMPEAVGRALALSELTKYEVQYRAPKSIAHIPL